MLGSQQGDCYYCSRDVLPRQSLDRIVAMSSIREFALATLDKKIVPGADTFSACRDQACIDLMVHVQYPTILTLPKSQSSRLLGDSYCPMKAPTSHTNNLSSQPQLAHHPSAPNKHQSTPITNSVCAPIRPISLPPPYAKGSPCPKPPGLPIPVDGGVPSALPLDPNADPSVQTRHVMSYAAESRISGTCGDQATLRTA